MSEPTYTYVKGKGWVPSNHAGVYKIEVRFGPDDTWHDEFGKGHSMYRLDYEKAIQECIRLNKHFQERDSRFAGWEARVVPLE